MLQGQINLPFSSSLSKVGSYKATQCAGMLDSSVGDSGVLREQQPT